MVGVLRTLHLPLDGQNSIKRRFLGVSGLGSSTINKVPLLADLKVTLWNLKRLAASRQLSASVDKGLLRTPFVNQADQPNDEKTSCKDCHEDEVRVHLQDLGSVQLSTLAGNGVDFSISIQTLPLLVTR